MPTDHAALYSGHFYPPEVVVLAVRLCFRFPPSLRMVEEMPAERGVVVSHETTRRQGPKFSGVCAAEIRRCQSATGDKCHLDDGAARQGMLACPRGW